MWGTRIAWSWKVDDRSMAAAILIIVALLLLGVELKFGTYGASAMVGAVLLSFGTISLMEHAGYRHPAFAISISVALGIITGFQGYLALRARKHQRLAGLEELIGVKGVSRTEISNRGTVVVRGEYWQATSREAIPAGALVSVERVEGLLLFVRES